MPDEKTEARKLTAIPCKRCGHWPEVTEYSETSAAVYCANPKCVGGSSPGPNREFAVGRWNAFNATYLSMARNPQGVEIKTFPKTERGGPPVRLAQGIVAAKRTTEGGIA